MKKNRHTITSGWYQFMLEHLRHTLNKPAIYPMATELLAERLRSHVAPFRINPNAALQQLTKEEKKVKQEFARLNQLKIDAKEALSTAYEQYHLKLESNSKTTLELTPQADSPKTYQTIYQDYQTIQTDCESLLALYQNKLIHIAQNKEVIADTLRIEHAYQPQSPSEKIELLYKLVKRAPCVRPEWSDFEYRLNWLFKQGLESIADNFIYDCARLRLDPDDPPHHPGSGESKELDAFIKEYTDLSPFNSLCDVMLELKDLHQQLLKSKKQIHRNGMNEKRMEELEAHNAHLDQLDSQYHKLKQHPREMTTNLQTKISEMEFMREHIVPYYNSHFLFQLTYYLGDRFDSTNEEAIATANELSKAFAQYYYCNKKAETAIYVSNLGDFLKVFADEVHETKGKLCLFSNKQSNAA